MQIQNRFLDQERAEFLQIKVEASKKRERLASWPREDKELPVVELDVNWVRFSTINHRTSAEQKRAIQITGNPGLFTDDPIGKTAQDAQYEILTQPSAFVDIKADLKIRGQIDNAVVTADGFLINGNRRAAALRSLLQDDHHLNANYIRCHVLPFDTTSAEIIRLETELQVAEVFKEDYSWVNRALLIEELYEQHDKNFDVLAALMHRKVEEIKEDFEKIQQLNQLVALSQGEYLHVDFEANESAFDELSQHIKNKNAREQESVRNVYFLGTLTETPYRKLRHLRRPDGEELVADELREDPQLASIIELVEAQTEINSSDHDELLDDVLGEEPENSIVRQILEFMGTHDKEEPIRLLNGDKLEMLDVREGVARAVIKAADEAAEQLKDINAVKAPMLRLEKAKTEMSFAKNALGKARAIPGWNEEEFVTLLTEVEEILGIIREDI